MKWKRMKRGRRNWVTWEKVAVNIKIKRINLKRLANTLSSLLTHFLNVPKGQKNERLLKKN